MLIAGKYEVPDTCPADCSLKEDMSKFGQNSICGRCPVFNCSRSAPDEQFPKGFCLLEPEQYRPDWAAEWVEFFKTGKFPELPLENHRSER